VICFLFLMKKGEEGKVNKNVGAQNLEPDKQRGEER
jgi:hypothetical protein